MPLSMKVLRLLIHNDMTVKEIRDSLKDIAQATLYRHIKKMHSAGLVKISKEEIVNGIIKKTYTIDNAKLELEDIKDMTNEEYEGFFMKFIAILVADFKDNLDNNKDCKKEISFTQLAIYLSEEEEEELSKEITEVLTKYRKNKKTKNRKQKILSSIYMPGTNKGEDSDN